MQTLASPSALLQNYSFKRPISCCHGDSSLNPAEESGCLLPAPSPGFISPSRPFLCHCQLFQGPFTLTPPIRQVRAIFLGLRPAGRRAGRGPPLRKDLIGCSVKGSTCSQAQSYSDVCPHLPVVVLLSVVECWLPSQGCEYRKAEGLASCKTAGKTGGARDSETTR